MDVCFSVRERTGGVDSVQIPQLAVTAGIGPCINPRYPLDNHHSRDSSFVTWYKINFRVHFVAAFLGIF